MVKISHCSFKDLCSNPTLLPTLGSLQPPVNLAPGNLETSSDFGGHVYSHLHNLKK